MEQGQEDLEDQEEMVEHQPHQDQEERQDYSESQGCLEGEEVGGSRNLQLD